MNIGLQSSLWKRVLITSFLVATLLPTSIAKALDKTDRFFLSAGLTGYTIVPLQSEKNNPFNIAFRMELHRNVSFMARAAKNHMVSAAFDFVGVDISKKWRSLMAAYSYKNMLIRIQTGQVAGKFGNGEAFTGPYLDVIGVRYGKSFAAIGARYTRQVRPVTTSTHSAAGGDSFGLDKAAYIETIGPVLFTDRMFEAIRDKRLYGPGIYEVNKNSAFGLDVIVQLGLSHLRNSLAYKHNVQDSPNSFLSFHGSTELRGHLMYLPSDRSIAGSGGFFVKNTMVGSGSDSSDNLRPQLTTEFHLGPFVRFGGLF